MFGYFEKLSINYSAEERPAARACEGRLLVLICLFFHICSRGPASTAWSHTRFVCTNVDPTLSQINVTSRPNICKMVRKTELKSTSISFWLFQYRVIFHLYWFNLLDPRLVDPGSTLIYVGAYGPNCLLCKLFSRQAPVSILSAVSADCQSVLALLFRVPFFSASTILSGCLVSSLRLFCSSFHRFLVGRWPWTFGVFQ